MHTVSTVWNMAAGVWRRLCHCIASRAHWTTTYCTCDVHVGGANGTEILPWFIRGEETILGETSDPCEIFLVDSCEDMLLSAVAGKVSVQQKTYPSDWHMKGGQEEAEDDKSSSFHFQKWYDPDTARFEDPPAEFLAGTDGVCCSCVRNKRMVTQLISVHLSSFFYKV